MQQKRCNDSDYVSYFTSATIWVVVEHVKNSLEVELPTSCFFDKKMHLCFHSVQHTTYLFSSMLAKKKLIPDMPILLQGWPSVYDNQY